MGVSKIGVKDYPLHHFAYKGLKMDSTITSLVDEFNKAYKGKISLNKKIKIRLTPGIYLFFIIILFSFYIIYNVNLKFIYISIRILFNFILS